MTTPNLPPPAKDLWAFAHHFTRDDCEKLEQLGFLDYRYELMNGIIIPKTPIYLSHTNTLEQIKDWLKGHFGNRNVIGPTTIAVAPEETISTHPEPDIVLLNKPGTEITTNEPVPSDIDLIVEVSVSTLEYDLGTKAGVYARAGIAQYLVVDVSGRVVYDHVLAAGGTYTRETRSPGDTITLLRAPKLLLRVDNLLLP